MSFRINLAKKYGFSLVLIYIVAIVGWFTFSQNREIFELKPEVLTILNEAINALVLLVIPFIFGSIAASARVMISDLKVEENINLIAASGLMSSFSWLGIKSKVFIALLTPYIAKDMNSAEVVVSQGSSEFYSMALVAVLVGAFASNLYIFVAHKVESITNSSGARNKSTQPTAEASAD